MPAAEFENPGRQRAHGRTRLGHRLRRIARAVELEDLRRPLHHANDSLTRGRACNVTASNSIEAEVRLDPEVASGKDEFHEPRDGLGISRPGVVDIVHFDHLVERPPERRFPIGLRHRASETSVLPAGTFPTRWEPRCSAEPRPNSP